MIKLQVTLFDKNGMYRPISTIVNIESMNYYTEHKREVQGKAILNICHNRRTSWQELKRNGYVNIKVREYDLEKIKAEQEKQKTIDLLKKIERERQEKKLKNI